MPIEVLEIIVNINYNMPRPRPADPGVLFDVLKVRSGVDEATTLAVRAANDLVSSTLTNVFGGGGGGPLSASSASGHGPKLSRERKLRMRELACQRLARAYRWDEIACSVATMQGASALEQVGTSVLQRNSDDLDAKYVHFFHEKIPSRQLVETTDLQPLTDIIASSYGQAEVLRTRATVKVFREDFDGAAQDLTDALHIARYRGLTHTASDQAAAAAQLQLARSSGGKRQQDVILAEDEQPTGLVTQLLFHRASVYLTLACRQVAQAMLSTATDDASTPETIAESRKLVKTLAKRALKDYMAFITSFDYSPNVPNQTIFEFNDRISAAAYKIRHTRSNDASTASIDQQPTVYALSDLFAAVPPSDLPAYPPPDDVQSSSDGDKDTTELATYHPLLTDALHAILMCHCLVQTSAKELLRHAYMVARLVRLTDGYPIFHASRSPARSDWVEVVRRTKNWVQLSASWEDLCAPVSTALLPERDSAAAAAKLMNKHSAEEAAGSGKRDKPSSSPWPIDETKEYPFVTERAPAIVRWVREAPLVTGTSTKRKKRPKKPASGATAADDVADETAKLAL